MPSTLLRFNEKGAARPVVSGRRPSLEEKFVSSIFYGFTKTHPCLGARGVIPKGNMFISFNNAMGGLESAINVLDSLEEYYIISDNLDDVYKSCALVFLGEPIESQQDFASKFWSFTQTLHDIDILRYDWDQKVASDIAAENFEISFCSRAVFTTTLNPRSPRRARAFPYPAWVMNQLSQFNALRKMGEFVKWQNTIRELDSQLDPSGQPNPVLTDHGTSSAASQLAGSAVTNNAFKVRSSHEERRMAFEAVRADAVTAGVARAYLEFLDMRFDEARRAGRV